MLTTVSLAALALALAGSLADAQERRVPLAAIASTTPLPGAAHGYWQQRADYTIHARLDESTGVLRASGRLRYVNQSPDTLRALWLHQHLNAFRPGSRWSAVDAREGRQRFQRLAEPDYAYERFTAHPVVDGVPVVPDYPGAPDSSVVRLPLPRPLAPGDSLDVTLAWDARLSTLPRRQGRQGRAYDFAQWYPRVAVYDRTGWRARALQPAGEFYGEFGTFDVTLDLPDDQVLGTTGVVVEGDPGWARALRHGVVAAQPAAYPTPPGAALPDDRGPPPPGHRRVRVLARDVHHFGWSVSPDYRYEGGWYVRARPAPAMRFPVWDSVAVHALYRPGDEAAWGNGVVLARTRTALAWLEDVFGPYGYPQMTALHRIEGGGTEFPMLMMNGSPSQGLILHEGGHIFAHGILANNEWASGWMDEGLTSYQTAWAQALTEQDQQGDVPPAPRASGYAGLGLQPDRAERLTRAQALLDVRGDAQPIGLDAGEFRDYGTYARMVYGRAEWMFGALRDALGDTAFRAFLRRYYADWAFRHVDELAMRQAAEAASGQRLDWFFDQWVHRTGLVDYALRDVDLEASGDGQWTTRATLVRRGAYRHPMPLGVRTASGWTTVRGDPLQDRQRLAVETAAPPCDVRLDPLRTTPDWFGPNDVVTAVPRLDPRTSRLNVDWPLVRQEADDRFVTLLAPLVWYSKPGGLTGALRARSHYLGLLDRVELAFAVSTRLPDEDRFGSPETSPGEGGSPAASRFQGWFVREAPYVPGATRPLNGLSFGVWRLDGIWKADVRQEWEADQLVVGGRRLLASVAATGTYPYDDNFYDPQRWSGRSATDLRAAVELRPPGELGIQVHLEALGGYASGDAPGGEPVGDGFYYRGEAWVASRTRSPTGSLVHFWRVYAAVAEDTPVERAVYASALTPTRSFANHLLRPEGAPLADANLRYIPIGGAALRGYSPLLTLPTVVALNLEESVRLTAFGDDRRLELFATAFADAGVQVVPDTLPDGSDDPLLADAGVGLALRGPLVNRDVRLRVDFPLWVSRPELAYAWSASRDSELAVRVTFSLTDVW